MNPNGANEQTVFETRGRTRSTALEQARPGREDDYLEYGSADVPGLPSPPSVLVSKLAYEQLRDHTMADYPNETTGVLVGRPCRDGHGDYILIKAAVVAEGDEFVGTPGNFRISGEGRISLAQRAARMFPGDQVVGVFHSHPHSPPRFSEVDFREQAVQHSTGVGIVVGAQEFGMRGSSRDADPLGVYIGPNATQLWRLSRAQGNASRSLAPAEAVPPPKPETHVDRPPDQRGRIHPPVPSKLPKVSRPSRKREMTPPRVSMPENVTVPVAFTLVGALVVAILASTVWISTQSIDRGDIRGATVAAIRVSQAKASGLTVPGPLYCREGESILAPLSGSGQDPTVTIVAANDPGIASVEITPQGRALRIECLVEGDTSLTVDSPGGSGIVVPLHVAQARPASDLDEVADL